MTPIAVFDFFSGCGGTSLGLRDAGMNIVGGLDSDEDAADTFRENFPEAGFIERDIREVAIDEVHQLVPAGQPLLLSGCAPCQPFSKQNRFRSQSDPDGKRTLLREFQKFVVALEPDYVVVENVPGLQKIENEGPFYDFIKALSERDYQIDWGILSALNYGVPQVRKRLVLVASLKNEVKLPSATHGPGLEPAPVVKDYIWGLPRLEAGESDPDDPDHAAMNLSKLNIERISTTLEGKGRESWPPHLVLDCHRGHDGHSDVYGRLAWDKPAAAITTRCLSYSNGRFGHPVDNRAISLREAACLQTFPCSFRFRGSLLSRGRQVGNAVPPLMAQAVGRAFARSGSLMCP
jgi:DNA (cytosine-5)-methyltransferase 1